jgi:hypothetical protein
MRRHAFAALAAVGLGLALASPAFAASYQLDNISANNVVPGQSVQVHGNGFAPGSSVTASVSCPGIAPESLGTFAANDTGVVDAAVALPANLPPGVACTVTLSGVDRAGAPHVVSFTVNVGGASAAAPVSTTGSSLPFTGGSFGTLLALGVTVCVVGASVLATSRRRRAG